MKKDKLSKLKLPDKPVCICSKGKAVLYVGKASSLRNRVKSYFSSDLCSTRGPRLVKMITLAGTVQFFESDSVLEALILEANLIKNIAQNIIPEKKTTKVLFL